MRTDKKAGFYGLFLIFYLFLYDLSAVRIYNCWELKHKSKNKNNIYPYQSVHCGQADKLYEKE
jgi:hypothetical protein